MESYLKFPLNFAKIVLTSKVKKCTTEESIAQFIMTLITSRYGEIPGKEDFGSDVWELEFDQMIKLYQWEDQVQKSIIVGIEKYEKRLRNVKVFVKLREIDAYNDEEMSRNSEVRRQAVININGTIKATDQQFNFGTKIYISPLSQ